MDQKMKRSILVRFERVQKMIATAEVTEATFVGAKAVRNAIPSRTVEFGCGHFGSQKTHTTSTIRNRKLAPIALAGQHGRPRR
jgi:hypothetical protein